MAINWGVVDPEMPYKVGTAFDTGRRMALKDLFDQQAMQMQGQQMQMQQQKIANYPRELALNEALTSAKIGELQAHADERASNAKKRQRVDDLFSKYSSMPDGPERKAIFQELAMVLSPATAFKEPSAPKIEEEWGGTESNPMKRQIVRNADGTVKPVSGWVPMHSKQVVNVGGGTPFFQAIPTPQGIMSFDARSGRISPVAVDGAPVMKSADSPELQGRIAGAKQAGKDSAETEGSLKAAEASLPQLDNTVKELKGLSKDATFTYAGRARDAVARQVGVATEGAVAREKYIQTVRDVLFPQLRQTFGAQFTVKEGEALIATLGDPNKTPEERNAALDAFIDQKRQTIESLKRQTGKQPSSAAKPTMQEWMAKARAANPGASGAELEAFYLKKYGTR